MIAIFVTAWMLIVLAATSPVRNVARASVVASVVAIGGGFTKRLKLKDRVKKFFFPAIVLIESRTWDQLLFEYQIMCISLWTKYEFVVLVMFGVHKIACLDAFGTKHEA